MLFRANKTASEPKEEKKVEREDIEEEKKEDIIETENKNLDEQTN